MAKKMDDAGGVGIVEEARAKYEADRQHWGENYRKGEDDLRFQSDEEGAQWDVKELQLRTKEGRPIVTIDQLSQFVHQVANDIRQNTPTIDVLPAGEEASVEDAEILKGLIRGIEYDSVADDAYDTAALSAVRCGIGFIRVTHDYADDNSFNQLLAIKRVVDPFACYLDGNSIECDGRDAMHCTIVDKYPLALFKKKWPKKQPVCFDSGSDYSSGKEGTVSVAEFYKIEETEKRVAMREGSDEIVDYDASEEASYVVDRTIKQRRVLRYVLSGAEVLEEGIFPGIYVPLVPVYGEEMWIKDKRYLYSLIRKAKQGQQHFNRWKSLESEMLLKQPQAPVMAPEGSTEDYADDWLNPTKVGVLRYKLYDTQGRQLPLPARLSPPQIPAGFINAARESVDDIKATLGLYNASIGNRSNETSGVAINARKMQGENATFHFPDNTVRSITQVGRILVFAAHEVYDARRIVRIIDAEESSRLVGINGALTSGQKASHFLTQGRYSVRVSTGASHATKRQEATALYGDIIRMNPQMMMYMGDLFFANSDVAGAPAMAARMKKLLPPQLKEEENGGDDKQKQMMAMLEKLQQEKQALAAQLEAQQGEHVTRMETERFKLTSEAQLRAKELALKERELAIKEFEAQARVASQASAVSGGQTDMHMLLQRMAMLEHLFAAQSPVTQAASTESGGQPDPSYSEVDGIQG